MTKNVPSWLLVLLLSLLSSLSINAYPNLDFLEDKDGHRQKHEDSPWPFIDQPAEESTRTPRHKVFLQKMQEFLGIRSQSEKSDHRKVPQFMMELYNIVTENTQDQNMTPYNAKIVRSFIERDMINSLSNFYFFNISGLEKNESILGAELHIYRKKTPMKYLFPYPYYLIKLYQVLEDRSLDTPDLHKLLNVSYIGAQAYGWQVFNVKEAVLGWMSDEPNLGLLMTISTVFKKKVSIEFFHRNDHHNKQPILVLFDDINSNRKRPVKPPYYAYKSQENEEDREMEEDEEDEEDREMEEDEEEEEENEDEEEEVEKEQEEEDEENIFYEKNEDDLAKNYKRKKQQGARFDGQPEEVLWTSRREPEFFQRQKRRREKDEEKSEKNEPTPYDDRESEMLALEEATMGRRRRDTTSPRRRSNRIVSKNRTSKIQRVLISMDIYERAEFRERLGQTIFNQSTKTKRLRRSNNQNMVQANTTETCTRHELNVDFTDIGLSSIIAPADYAAYQCKGKCESPLTQDHQPTNHATIQAIVHKMGLVEGVEKPCCVPTKLQSISILYLENEHVVLKKYEDMVAERCGCR